MKLVPSIAVNKKTGEVQAEIVIGLPNKVPSPFGDMFMALNQSIATAIAGSDLTQSEYKVLFAFFGAVGFENVITIHAAKTAEQLHMKPSNFSVTVKKLVEKGFLIQGDKKYQNGPHKCYWLNPRMAWKGSTVNHKKSIKAENTKPKFKLLPGGKKEEQQELSL
jgi:hypothetical protein